MPINQEHSIYRIRIPADSRKREVAFRKMRHRLAEELPCSSLRFFWDLFPRKWHGSFAVAAATIEVSYPVQIARVLITDLHLALVCVRLDEKPSFCVEQNW